MHTHASARLDSLRVRPTALGGAVPAGKCSPIIKRTLLTSLSCHLTHKQIYVCHDDLPLCKLNSPFRVRLSVHVYSSQLTWQSTPKDSIWLPLKNSLLCQWHTLFFLTVHVAKACQNHEPLFLVPAMHLYVLLSALAAPSLTVLWPVFKCKMSLLLWQRTPWVFCFLTPKLFQQPFLSAFKPFCPA